MVIPFRRAHPVQCERPKLIQSEQSWAAAFATATTAMMMMMVVVAVAPDADSLLFLLLAWPHGHMTSVGTVCPPHTAGSARRTLITSMGRARLGLAACANLQWRWQAKTTDGNSGSAFQHCGTSSIMCVHSIKVLHNRCLFHGYCPKIRLNLESLSIFSRKDENGLILEFLKTVLNKHSM